MRAQFQLMSFVLLAGLTPAAEALAAAALPPIPAGLVVQEPRLSSLAAQKLVDACVAVAGAQPMAVAVVDPAGNLLHFHAVQGASPTAPITAQRKAETAARWRRSTEQLDEGIRGTEGNRGPVYLGDFPVGGGVPIIRDGHTLGAIGVAGPADPEGCAEKAIRAVFGNSVEAGRPR
jgi:glc operon protein GlcG